MTVEELKAQALAMHNDIQACLDEDGEWTSPRGNGTNSFEAIEVSQAFMDLINQLES